MKNQNTPRAANGDMLRILGQIALDYYEAANGVWDARHMLELASKEWAAKQGVDVPAHGTPEWQLMVSTTTAEYEYLQRMKTRRNYVQDRLFKRAGSAIGVNGKRWNTQAAGAVPRKLALLDLHQKLADPKQQRALEKRRLSAALSDAGISRSVALQICRDYFGPLQPESNEITCGD